MKNAKCKMMRARMSSGAARLDFTFRVYAFDKS